MPSSELLDILVCPVCSGALQANEELHELWCLACALAYPLRGNIPVMLPAEARCINSARAEGLVP